MFDQLGELRRLAATLGIPDQHLDYPAILGEMAAFSVDRERTAQRSSSEAGKPVMALVHTALDAKFGTWLRVHGYRHWASHSRAEPSLSERNLKAQWAMEAAESPADSKRTY